MRSSALIRFFFALDLLLVTRLVAAADLDAGTARGSFSYDDTTAELKFAAAYVAPKETEHPVILILSDMKLPTERWWSEFDIMREKSKWSGVVFFLKHGEVFRTDVHVKGQQSTVSGYFDLKLDDPAATNLAGHATCKGSDKGTKLDVTFRALGR